MLVNNVDSQIYSKKKKKKKKKQKKMKRTVLLLFCFHFLSLALASDDLVRISDAKALKKLFKTKSKVLVIYSNVKFQKKKIPEGNTLSHILLPTGIG